MLGASLAQFRPPLSTFDQRRAKLRQVLLDHTPHAARIDGSVAVDQNIPKGDDLAKIGNFFCHCSIEARQLRERFAHDLDLPLDR